MAPSAHALAVVAPLRPPPQVLHVVAARPAVAARARRVRPVATALLLCVGMAVIPLVALGASTDTAGPGTTRAAGPSPAAATADPRRPARLLVVATPAVVRATPAGFSTPLAVAARAPAASRVPVALPARPAVVPSYVRHTNPPARTVKVVAHAPVAPPPPLPAAAGRGHAQQGLASWYNAPHGTCAHPSLPMGTVLTITDVATGRTVTCRVDDRGPYAAGRVVDLSPDVFARLVPLGLGVDMVRVTW